MIMIMIMKFSCVFYWPICRN